jgi:hypothetical protein
VLLPTYSSWLSRIEGHFAALRSFVIAGSDHPNQETIERAIHRYLHWRRHNRENSTCAAQRKSLQFADGGTRRQARQDSPFGGSEARASLHTMSPCG